MANPIYSIIEEIPNDPIFRILTLHPAESLDDDIQCSLTETRLNDPPPYEALSYSWGDASNPLTIHCNGHPIQVTQNLFAALRHLRDAEDERVLWIDALCINQADFAERASQVQLMRDIYKKADTVVAWLGNEAEGSELVFPMCQRLVVHRADVLFDDDVISHWEKYVPTVGTARIRERLRQVQEAKEKLDAGDSNDDDGVEVEGEDNNNDNDNDDDDETNDVDDDDEEPDSDPTKEEINAFIQFIQRPWFTRTWVLQELCFGRRVVVVCGDACISWQSLFVGFVVAGLFNPKLFGNRPEAKVVRGILYQGVLSSPFHTRAFDMAAAERDAPMMDLLSLLWATHFFAATDLRDKVYALLGMTDTEQIRPLTITPDYTISIEKCYHSTACAILMQTETLDLLLSDHTPRKRPTTEQLPSWVPDWGGKTPDSPLNLLYNRNRDDPAFLACGPDAGSYTPIFADNDRTLVLSGFIIDHVTALAPALPTSPGEHEPEGPTAEPGSFAWLGNIFVGVGDYFDKFVSWEKLALDKSHKVYPNSEDSLRAFVATISLGRMPDGIEAAIAGYQQWSRRLSGPRKLSHLRRVGARGSLYKSAVCISGSAGHLFRSRPSASQDSSDEKVIGEAFNQSLKRTTNRGLARTQGGCLGLVPAATQIGDSIALFRGGKAAFVIRKTNVGEEWTLVGPAYVHGVMQGELWDEGKCSDMHIV